MDEFKILSLSNIKGIASIAPKIISVTCQPPPHAWIKVNIDGSARWAPERS